MKNIAQKDSNYKVGCILVVDDDTNFRKKEWHEGISR